MYLNQTATMPSEKGQLKTISKIPYVYYEIGRKYYKEKKYNSAKRVCIGNDVSRLQFMLEKVEGYGCQHIGFILDRVLLQ